MLNRLNQLARHLSHQPLLYPRRIAWGGSHTMISSIEDRATRKFYTAACIIIGDEILGGKVPIGSRAY